MEYHIFFLDRNIYDNHTSLSNIETNLSYNIRNNESTKLLNILNEFYTAIKYYSNFMYSTNEKKLKIINKHNSYDPNIKENNGSSNEYTKYVKEYYNESVILLKVLLHTCFTTIDIDGFNKCDLETFFNKEDFIAFILSG
jgi:hypothetical protein